MELATHLLEIQPAGGFGAGLADPNGPRCRGRGFLSSHFSRVRVSVGWVLGLKGFREGRCGRFPFGVASVPLQPGSRRLGTDRGCRSACLFFWLGSLLSGRVSTALDCSQCWATAFGRLGGDHVPCA